MHDIPFPAGFFKLPFPVILTALVTEAAICGQVHPNDTALRDEYTASVWSALLELPVLL